MDERTQKFYEDYILTNEDYVEKEAYPLENIKRECDKMLLSTKYGDVRVSPNNIKRAHGFTINSAVDKTHYFKALLKEQLPESYRDMELISFYKSYHKTVFFKTRYGLIKTKPGYLLSGCYPTIKSAVNKTEYWINQAIEVYGDKYNYSLVDYINSATKIDIICKKHGVFTQTPASHLSEHGCPGCGRKILERLEKNKKEYIGIPAKLYILELKNEEESFFKIGVTRDKIKYRAKRMRPYKYTLLKDFDLNLYEAVLKEYEWLEILKQYQHTPEHKFKGYTECFSINPLEKLKINLTEF